MKKFTLKCNECGSENTDIYAYDKYGQPLYKIECYDCKNKAKSLDDES